MSSFVRFCIIAVAALALCACAAPAFADSQSVSGCTNCDGYAFQANLNSLGGDNYSLSYTITNVAGAPANAQSWSLTLFGSNQDIGPSFSNFTMSDGNTGAYNVLVGKSNNGNGNCNSNISNALCVTSSGLGALSTIGLGKSLTFNFDFSCTNCTELANWIFLSSGSCVTGSGNCYAISTPSNGGVPVPEPSSPILLASSLLAALSLLAVPRVRSTVFAAGYSWMHGPARTI